MVPKTLQGRLFCVLYALIGLPGTCLTLKSTGDKITDLFINLNYKSGAKSCVDNDCGYCSLSTTINGSLGLLETLGMVIYRVFLLYFHDFEYNWFWRLLAAI